MPSAGLHDDVVDAALSTAATLLGMQVVYLGSIDFDGDTYRFDRVIGESAGVREGDVVPFATTYCRQMVDGASPATADVSADPVYGAITPLPGADVVSYVGVPVRNRDGRVIGTLCGFDARALLVADHVVGVLRELAGIISAHLGENPREDAVTIRRTPQGWAVGQAEHETSLTSAMILADLLAEDLGAARRPEARPAELDEVSRLRASVAQLEHALAARVLVEQAIGVVAERHGVAPRDAFEALRKVARRGGIRVHALARDVVASVTDPSTNLPPELARRS